MYTTFETTEAVQQFCEKAIKGKSILFSEWISVVERGPIQVIAVAIFFLWSLKIAGLSDPLYLAFIQVYCKVEVQFQLQGTPSAASLEVQ